VAAEVRPFLVAEAGVAVRRLGEDPLPSADEEEAVAAEALGVADAAAD
jgi:hypothetical protein